MADHLFRLLPLSAYRASFLLRGGTIPFSDFAGHGEITCKVDPQKSAFNYLRTDSATQEAERFYHLHLRDGMQREYLLHERKYMQNEPRGGFERRRTSCL